MSETSINGADGQAAACGPSPFGEAEAARWFFDNASDLFAVVSAEGRFVTVNRAWTTLTGWSADELVGQPTIKFTHPESQAGLIETRHRLCETGTAVNEVRVLCEDGRWVWLQGRYRLGPNGEMIGLMHDISTEVEARAELEAARRTHEMLAEAAGIGIWSYEPESRRIDWSPDALALLGLSPSDIATAPQFLDRLHVDQRTKVGEAFRRAVENGEGGTMEYRLRGDDGRWHTFRGTYRPEPRPCGLYALKGISQNITDVARSRDKAIWSERRARRLIEEAPFAVGVYDLDMRLRLVSPKFLEIFKETEARVIGRTLQELTHGGRRRFVAAVARALSGETVVRREDRLQDAEGGEHCLRWEAHPWRDVAGQIVGVITYMDDVTALAAARREARINARRLKVALGAARAGVYEIDHESQSFWGSPEFHRMMGRRIGYEDVREAVWPMIHPDDREQLYAAAAEWGRAGGRGAHEYDVRLMSIYGEPRWVRVFHDARRDASGRPRKAFGLVLDIDARKKAELALMAAERAAQAASEAKAQFLANMSHEIRTPMNGVLGVMHVLKRELPAGDSANLLGEALAAGQMLSTLLDDVIDISRIEAGRLELNREPVDPADVVRGVARLLAGQATHKGLRLELDIAGDLGWVETDATRLRQALFNLIGNAVKFTLKGSVTVRARKIAGGERLVFDVVDTGVGVPFEAQERLFERFQQADASTTRRFGGSGLGLAISRKLARMLGGDITFQSAPGQGSTFTLTIAAPATRAPAATAEAPENLLAGLRILVVEDNPTNQLVARRILEQLGAAVSVADDGASGVAAARDEAFDLILMDVQMPGMDGLEAARRIRALPGEAGRAPIIALTANVMAHQRAAYRAAGMDGVAAKPIAPAALVAEIVHLSQGRSSADRDAEEALA
ncbi:PAS domain S-box protein [Caulobacter sp.]|uniref:PAS domain-containing sensor histidine kinase n=1 Tax=Caulobacter sp. TaxID=78 RepID=UPI002B478904|nr:PAS domain S-box protein [Caulobacter sp.]HJV42632.1 PAS domain S-box protein [Caulobacter sp.]